MLPTAGQAEYKSSSYELHLPRRQLLEQTSTFQTKFLNFITQNLQPLSFDGDIISYSVGGKLLILSFNFLSLNSSLYIKGEPVSFRFLNK